mmetsp:Transcript_29032/g.41581  ORF Transcript_29032/g.41581 Transcript_29032/m.41581 type:complete len:170 (+) Transcript_29032:201-710(+)|eukprot:CAMPEP_0172427340 /NCGR_PEP_ID=MMETSP1064-20121228/41749_1 /TAXON_ID=202472 /ORGANISM="Aulacoseira subarctica , Strain CCAP 1002/5" /LENGTH=169 /DNA_ID=CAMNT_0013171511 /DNA_START=121 /DNA_END=630 /DNA_ORIENTATION=-
MNEEQVQKLHDQIQELQEQLQSMKKNERAAQQEKVAIEEMKRKSELLENLKNKTYVKLAPSQNIGNRGKEIGVFAIRDIPKGIDPFTLCNVQADEPISLSEEEIEELPVDIKGMLYNFFLPDEITKKFPIYSKGINGIDASFYLNSAEKEEDVNLRTMQDHEKKRGLDL